MGLDERYQSGRENFAASADADKLRVNINELTSPLEVGNSAAFVPTDTAFGHNGRLFIAGYRIDDGDRPWVRIVTQKGEVTEQPLSEAAIAQGGEPVIGFVERNFKEGDDDVTRYEFVVSFGSEQTPDGAPGGNGVDVHTLLYFFDTAQDPDSYAPVWGIVTGTSGDDFPRWTGIDEDGGYVVNAGETNGQWTNENAAGGVDSFLQRIDTTVDGNSVVPVVAWTRQVGSAGHDESVVGGSTSTSSPLLIGDSSGAVSGQPQLGGKDAFFYIASSADSTINVRQRGTAGNEDLSDGIYGTNNVWLVGQSTGNYSVESGDGNRSLKRRQINSQAGFALSYTALGDVTRAFTFNDLDDASTESLRAVRTYDRDILVAGSTNGNFSESEGNSQTHPILARISLEENSDDDTDSSREWRTQLPLVGAEGEIERLENYRDDEITALVKIVSGASETWEVRLFTGEGLPLH